MRWDGTGQDSTSFLIVSSSAIEAEPSAKRCCRRIELITWPREKHRKEFGAANEDSQGCAVCGAGVLLVLHHVSLRQQQVLGGIGANKGRLLFMTYNGWIMLAVAVGAFVGYLMFSNSSPTKSAACH